MAPDTGASTFRVAADAYDRLVGRYGRELAAGLIDVAGIPEGSRVLDVGCGPGALTRALAERLGPEAVGAVDPSEPFVEACRARVPGADVRLGSAEALPFEDGAFGAVLSQLVVNFIEDPHAGVREMRRVTAPGGVMASSVWDYAGGMTFLRTFWDAAVALGLPGARERDEARAMRFATLGDLAGLWREAGLEDVHSGPLDVAADYRDFNDLWEPLEQGVGPSGAYASGLGPDERRKLREELWRRLGEPDGPFRLQARAWYARGIAPS